MTDKANTNPARARSTTTPVLQPGEDAGALAATQIDALSPDGDQQAMLDGPGGLAELQKKVDTEGMQSVQAVNRPTSFRRDNHQHADNGVTTLDMPTMGSLEAMLRPDHNIEPVNDLLRWKSHADELAFLNEFVMIRIPETGDPSAENPVPLGVNGRMVYITRGQDTIVRRHYVEQLFRARPETVNTRYERNAQGDIKNFVDKKRALKYPFEIVRDDNPRGRAWAKQLREQA